MNKHFPVSFATFSPPHNVIFEGNKVYKCKMISKLKGRSESDLSDPPITEVASGEACHYHRSLRLGPQSHFQICLSGYQKLSSARRSLPQLCFWKKSFGRWLQHLPNVFAAQHVVGLVPCKTQTRFYSLAPTLRMRIRPDFFAQNYRPAFFFFKNTVNTVHNVSL